MKPSWWAFCLITALTWLLAGSIHAAEQPLLDIDFSHSIWQELLVNEWGDATVASLDQGTLRIGVRGSWRTQFMPYRPGTKIGVQIRAKSVGIEPEAKPWSIGRTVLTGYDGNHKGICHYDVAMFKGDTGWKTYEKLIEFPELVKFYVLSITNSGSAGVAWFDDLRMWRHTGTNEALMGDSGFEGQLGADHWFRKREGQDWSDRELWSSEAAAEHDTDNAVAGSRCVKLQGIATLTSKLFDYNGEELVLSAWIRTRHPSTPGTRGSDEGPPGEGTRNTTPGARGADEGPPGEGSPARRPVRTPAIIHLLGLDLNGTIITHQNLSPATDTAGWQFLQKQLRFPDTVKQLQIWARKLGNTEDAVWFDEVALQRLPAAGELFPFNAESATLNIDAANPGPKINHRVWSGIDVSYIGRLLRTEQQEALHWLEEVGINMIRVRELSGYGMGTYNRDDPETGKPVYNWEKLDILFDLLVREHSFIPNITIESTPPALAREGTPNRNYCNRWPPTDYKKWGRYVEAFLDHVIERYGKEEVEKWYWEVWNEPMASGYYQGTSEEFKEIAIETYLASERVEKRHQIDLRMGLTSGGGWMNKHVLDKLREAGRLGLVDHYTEHFYLGARAPLRVMDSSINSMRELLTQYPQIGLCELGSTEWNCNSMGGPPAQQPWNATCVIKTVRIMLDAGLDYTTFFSYFEYPHKKEESPTFSGSLAMIALNGIPKPVYNAFVFLHKLRGGRRLEALSTNDPIDGIAVLMPDGNIRIVLTSYDEDTSRHPYTTNVKIEIAGISEAYRCSRHWIADEDHGNSYAKWLELGRPLPADAEAKTEMLEAFRHGELPPVAVTSVDGGLKLTIDMPGPGIRLIEIVPERRR